MAEPATARFDANKRASKRVKERGGGKKKGEALAAVFVEWQDDNDKTVTDAKRYRKWEMNGERLRKAKTKKNAI